MIYEDIPGEEEKEKSIQWILDQGFPRQHSSGQFSKMVRALGLKPFFGMKDCLIFGLILSFGTGLMVMSAAGQKEFWSGFLFFWAPVFYATVLTFTAIKEWQGGIRDMVKVTKYGNEGLLSLRMLYLSSLSVLLLILQQILFRPLLADRITLPELIRCIWISVCGLFFYSALELLVRLMAKRRAALTVVPLVWPFGGMVIGELIWGNAGGGMKTEWIGVLAMVFMLVYLFDLRIQASVKREEVVYAFH